MKIRKNYFLPFYVLFVSMSVFSLAQGSQIRNVPAFNGVKVFGNIQVNLQKGQSQQVRVSARGVDIEKVNTYVDDGLLKIKMQEGIYKETEVKVVITYTQLIEITASGSARIYVNSKIEQSKFYADVNSGGFARLNVSVEEIKLNLHSGGELDISGRAQSQQSKVVSGAQLYAVGLESDHVTIKTNTGGMAEVFVKKSIDGTAATGGGIRYKGNPKISNVKGTLGGSVSRY